MLLKEPIENAYQKNVQAIWELYIMIWKYFAQSPKNSIRSAWLRLTFDSARELLDQGNGIFVVFL